MNIIFLGSAKFAVPSLKLLVSANHRISCVVTQPDRHKGRGLPIAMTPVKSEALALDLPLYQPKNINTKESADILRSFEPDLFIVIAYGQLLSQEILDIPKMLAINLHASLLPAYRGAAPINRALINGESETGVTVMKIVLKMDAGPVIAREKVRIERDDTSEVLEQKLSHAGSHLMLQMIKQVETSDYKLTPQDDKKATLAPKLTKHDGLIDWSWNAERVHNLIRGCLPWPGAFTYYKGGLLKVYEAHVAKALMPRSGAKPGTVLKVSREGIRVCADNEEIVISQLQLEGKRRMSAAEFISGHKIAAGDILGLKK